MLLTLGALCSNSTETEILGMTSATEQNCVKMVSLHLPFVHYLLTL